ncbi:MAG TPA: Lrp/AsnC family transcriptional regulator [Mycobacteriales bacterium]
MDAVDQKILTALLANGRATWAELGRHVGLSAPTVADRVARLERDGVITGYRAVVAPHAVGLGVSALVGVYEREGTDGERLVEQLRGLPEIEDCWFVAGDEELVVRLRVADVDALERALAVLRGVRGVSRTRTTVILSTRWESRFPLPALAESEG